MRTVLASPENKDGQELWENCENPIERRAMQFATQVVLCHNDALAGNVLFNDGWDQVRLIDYEYGGYNYRAFDLANHFCEHCGFDCDYEKWYPTPAQQVSEVGACAHRLTGRR